MKKYSLPLLGLALCLMLSGCNTTLMGNHNHEIPYETFDTMPPPEDPAQMLQYKAAMEALSNMDYQKALKLFTELGAFRDAAEYVARFTYIQDALLRSEQYTDGVLTQTTEYTYDQNGDPTASIGAKLLATEYSDNGNLKLESWQYSDYFLTVHYDAYTNIGAVTREEKRPIFHNTYLDAVKDGHSISYSYNYQGVLTRDNGELQQHTRVDGSTSIQKMLFNGTYTYDEDGKLIRYDREYTWGGMGYSWTVYEYDESGRLIREETHKEGTVFFGDGFMGNEYKTETKVMEYRYDADGNRSFFSQLTTLTSLNEPGETHYIQHEYGYENGRLVYERTTFGEGSDTVIETYYIYGEYLGYIAEQEVAINGG